MKVARSIVFITFVSCLTSSLVAASRAVSRRLDDLSQRVSRREKSKKVIERLRSEVSELESALEDESFLDRRMSIALWKASLIEKEEQEAAQGRFAHLYPEPLTWESERHFHLHGSQVAVRAGYETESAYFDRGSHIVDASVADLGSAPALKDFLLPSMLVSKSIAAQAGNNVAYVDELKDMPIAFSLRTTRQEGVITLSHSLFDGGVTFGCSVPYLTAQRVLRFTPKVTLIQKQNLENGATTNTVTNQNFKFSGLYGNSVDAFIKDIFATKGMPFREAHRLSSWGDITLFGHAVLPWKQVERLQFGMSVVAPHGKKPDFSVFYPARVGNGGFVQIGGNANVVLKKWRGFHPHVSLSCLWSLPATVQERVSPLETIAAATSLSTTSIPMNSLVNAPTQSTKITESVHPAYSYKTAKITLRPGALFSGRIGALWNGTLLRALQVDTAYEFVWKMRDIFHGGATADAWDVGPFKTRPTQQMHRLHLALNYQYNDNIHWYAKGFATVHGRSTPQLLSGACGVSYQW
jgi:hypothetical protein